jgi:hypothetical protein
MYNVLNVLWSWVYLVVCTGTFAKCRAFELEAGYRKFPLFGKVKGRVKLYVKHTVLFQVSVFDMFFRVAAVAL